MSHDGPQTLPDPTTGEPRFRIDRLLREGRNYDLALATDLLDDSSVVIKSVSVPAGTAVDELRRRQAALDDEMAAMESVSPHLPMPVALVQANSGDDGETEPLLVYRYVEGVGLREHLAARGGALELGEVLTIGRQIARGLDALHEHGWVHRSLSPEHVVVDDAGAAYIVGLGNAQRRGEAPTSDRPFVVAGYTAPEIAREQSGKLVTPRADAYSFGALLAWMASGDDPTGDPNSPYTRRTHERVAAVHPGLGLIIAHAMQPLHKQRFARVARYGELLDADALPSRVHPDFAAVALMAPWRGNRPDAGRIGTLTAGPLVNRPETSAAPASEVPDATPPGTERDAAPDACTTNGEGTRSVPASGALWAVRLVSAAIVVLALISLLRQLSSR